MVAHVPGLQVVFPATPYDAKGSMATAPERTLQLHPKPELIITVHNPAIVDLPSQVITHTRRPAKTSKTGKDLT